MPGGSDRGTSGMYVTVRCCPRRRSSAPGSHPLERHVIRTHPKDSRRHRRGRRCRRRTLRPGHRVRRRAADPRRGRDRPARGGPLGHGPRRCRPGVAEAAADLVRGPLPRERPARLGHLRRAGRRERGALQCAAQRGPGPPAGVRLPLRARPAAHRVLHPGAGRGHHRHRLAAAAARRRADRDHHHRQGHPAAPRPRPQLPFPAGHRGDPERRRDRVPLGVPPRRGHQPAGRLQTGPRRLHRQPPGRRRGPPGHPGGRAAAAHAADSM